VKVGVVVKSEKASKERGSGGKTAIEALRACARGKLAVGLSRARRRMRDRASPRGAGSRIGIAVFKEIIILAETLEKKVVRKAWSMPGGEKVGLMARHEIRGIRSDRLEGKTEREKITAC